MRLFRDEISEGLEGYLVHEPSRLLLVACSNNQADVAEYLLHNYAQYVDDNTYGKALNSAAFDGHENTLCTLLRYGFKLRAYLSAALPNAIHQGNVSCAERLITAGARLDLSISEHRKALYAAVRGDLDSTIAMLIQRDQLNEVDTWFL